MTQKLNILMAQMNPTVGAIDYNTDKIINIIKDKQLSHDIIVFPELALTGYPPEDLLFHDKFQEHISQALETIKEATNDCHIIIGYPYWEKNCCYNAAGIFYQGHLLDIYFKQELPNYGVFDEKRYFHQGGAVACTFTVKDYCIGLCICEDLWRQGPIDRLIEKECELLIVINASPYEYDKYHHRMFLLRQYAHQFQGIIYVNMVGGQDELVFDGQSKVVDTHGNICARSQAFREQLDTVVISEKAIQGTIAPEQSTDALIYQALVCGLRDYVEKNKFPGVLIGLSGGIDSALTLAIAVDALGADRVHAVFMPSRFTASISEEDALQQVNHLGVSYTNLSIEPTFNTILTSLAPSFAGQLPDATEENIQARIRGVFLMALSNKFGNMVVSTSNKSEASVGYATLYGDMAGGFSVLKDVLKTQVYNLARHRNTFMPVIPERVLNRPPSAELAENQTDQDVLPEYEILDAIITFYIEHKLSAEEIIENGYDADIVNKVIRFIVKNEYKRRQSAPGIKISGCAFGRDWRYPITSGFCS